jgi:DNA-binding ferritin-like protein
MRVLLCEILAYLRAQGISYQTSHWQVSGDDYYGNHLLFQRLYESSGEEVDVLAEKIVGYFGSEAVDVSAQIDTIQGYIKGWSRIGCHHERGLKSEQGLQRLLKMAYDSIKAADQMTLGIDDWIMATASSHESNQYLLQQVLSRKASVFERLGSESVAPTAEGDFYDSPLRKEVLEFAISTAVSNVPEVAKSFPKLVDTSESARHIIKDMKDSPPTPTEIKVEPGGEALSTLNRLVVESEDPDAAEAAEANQSKMAAWVREIDRRRRA